MDSVIAFYNIRLLYFLQYCEVSSVSGLSIYWKDQETFFETKSVVDLSIIQLKTLLELLDGKIISVHFILNRHLEIDSNTKDEIFIERLDSKNLSQEQFLFDIYQIKEDFQKLVSQEIAPFEQECLATSIIDD